MTKANMTPEQRRRNAQLAWWIAAFVFFVFVSSFAFWRGLANLIAGSVH